MGAANHPGTDDHTPPVTTAHQRAGMGQVATLRQHGICRQNGLWFFAHGHGLSGQDRLDGVRPVDEGKIGNIAQLQCNHAQDDFGQVGP